MALSIKLVKTCLTCVSLAKIVGRSLTVCGFAFDSIRAVSALRMSEHFCDIDEPFNLLLMINPKQTEKLD